MPQITIERLANGGDGVGHLADGRVVFVPRALPGDVVEVAVEKAKKRWARARLLHVVRPSQARIEPVCRHFDRCGGCAFQHFAYDAEFAAKAAAAREAFERISGQPPPEGRSLAAELPSHYRVRARLHTDGRVLGYVGAQSHDVFELQSCPVLHPVLDALLPALQRGLAGLRTEVEIETAGAGEAAITVHARGSEELARRLVSIENVRGVQFKHSGLTAGRYELDAGEVLGVELDLPLSPGRFRQSSGPMTPRLRELVRQRAGGGEQLIELFAGSGSFTFDLAAAFEAIAAFELDAHAVKMGNLIAGALRLDHVRFTVADLFAEHPDLPNGATVLLDPPRSGAAYACTRIADDTVGRIVYVSCDVGTLARDAKILRAGGYVLESFDLVDMFPRTAHIEAVATFTSR